MPGDDAPAVPDGDAGAEERRPAAVSDRYSQPSGVDVPPSLTTNRCVEGAGARGRSALAASSAKNRTVAATRMRRSSDGTDDPSCPTPLFRSTASHCHGSSPDPVYMPSAPWAPRTRAAPWSDLHEPRFRRRLQSSPSSGLRQAPQVASRRGFSCSLCARISRQAAPSGAPPPADSSCSPLLFLTVVPRGGPTRGARTVRRTQVDDRCPLGTSRGKDPVRIIKPVLVIALAALTIGIVAAPAFAG